MGVDPRSIDFEGKLPTRFKLSYGLVSLADGMMVTAFVQFLMIYLTDTVRVSPGAVGIALMVARLWDAVTDPVMGAISDRTRSRYGRRRPWLLWGCRLERSRQPGIGDRAVRVGFHIAVPDSEDRRDGTVPLPLRRAFHGLP